jgi:hypothetical protein
MVEQACTMINHLCFSAFETSSSFLFLFLPPIASCFRPQTGCTRQKGRMKWVQIALCAAGLLVGGMRGVNAKLTIKGRHSVDPLDRKTKKDAARKLKGDSNNSGDSLSCHACDELLPSCSLIGDVCFDWLNDVGINSDSLVIGGILERGMAQEGSSLVQLSA